MNKKVYDVSVVLLFNLSILKDYMGVWVGRRNIHGNITNYIPLHKFRVTRFKNFSPFVNISKRGNVIAKQGFQ